MLRKLSKIFFAVIIASLVLIPGAARSMTREQAVSALMDSGWSLKLAEKITDKALSSNERIVAVFDHDNTLICGDITEGNGKSQPGFMHSMLLKKHAKRSVPVPVPGLYEAEPWEFYHSWARSNPKDAYPWICTLLAGQKVRDVRRQARAYYQKYLQPAIYPEMKTLVEVLKALHVDVYIVSASANDVVKVSAEFFGVADDHVHGIRLQNIKGVIQTKVIYPISFAAGKTWYIQNFAGNFKPGNIMVFGDSYRTDGHMLRFAAAQGGLALLVNPSADLESTLEERDIHFYHLPSRAHLHR